MKYFKTSSKQFGAENIGLLYGRTDPIRQLALRQPGRETIVLDDGFRIDCHTGEASTELGWAGHFLDLERSS